MRFEIDARLRYGRRFIADLIKFFKEYLNKVDIFGIIHYNSVRIENWKLSHIENARVKKEKITQM